MSRKTYILLFVVSVALGLNAISNIYQYKIALAHPGSYISSEAGDTYLPLVFAQGLEDGDIFAGVMARCASSGSYIDRSFNNFNGEPITITDGDSLGYCKLLHLQFRFLSICAVSLYPLYQNQREMETFQIVLLLFFFLHRTFLVSSFLCSYHHSKILPPTTDQMVNHAPCCLKQQQQ